MNGTVSGAVSVQAGYAGSDAANTAITVTGSVTNQKTSGLNGFGMQVNNSGTGAVEIEVDGSVSGANGSGVEVNGTAGTLVITTGSTSSVVGSTFGIHASTDSVRGTTVETAGIVSGTSNNGIEIESPNGATVTQIAGSITGGTNGIEIDAPNSATVTLSGAVTGNSNDGLFITNASGTTDIKQLSGTIKGATQGIFLIQAAGDANITTSGTIIGGSDAGLELINGGTGAVTVTEAGGSVTGATNGMFVLNTNSAVTGRITIAGTLTGGSGYGLYLIGAAGSANAITLANGATVSATSGIAIRDEMDNAAVTLASGSKVVGAIVLGDGSDTLTIAGTADLSTTTLIDGGNSLDATVTDTGINTLKFDGANQTINGAIITNWTIINIKNGSVVSLADGHLNSGTGEETDGTRNGISILNTSTLASSTAYNISGDVYIDGTSELSNSDGGTITGNVDNSGELYWVNLGKTLTIDGNYTGGTGSSISFETYLGGDSSPTDKLVVTGTTSGTTTLNIRKVAGSTGGLTSEGIEIIQVDGVSAAGSFVLGTALQADAYQYILKQGNASGSDTNDWYLTDTYKNASGNTVPIYRPGVADYLTAQAANLEEAIAEISTFHNRQGEQLFLSASGLRSWAKAQGGTSSDAAENRFGYAAGRLASIEAGQDLYYNESDAGTTTRAAITADLSYMTAKISDTRRADVGLSTDTGRLRSTAYSLGATYTRVGASGAYLDMVARLSYLSNAFNVADTGTATQTAFRQSLSAEVGKPLEVAGSSFVVEPEAQAIAFHTAYQSFSDGVSSIGAYAPFALEGRAGLRFTQVIDPANAGRLYGTIDARRDFLRTAPIEIGTARVSDDFRHTRISIGAGFDVPTADGRLFGHAAFTQAVDGSDTKNLEIAAGYKLSF